MKVGLCYKINAWVKIQQTRMAKGNHGLPKVSPGPTMPNPSTPCGRATREIALRPFQWWPARWAGRMRPSSTTLYTPTPYEPEIQTCISIWFWRICDPPNVDKVFLRLYT
jgi:hypothetical protein